MSDLHKLDLVVKELLTLYSISAPPIPIESMLQHPHPNMWNEVDLKDLSSSFLNISTPFSPRISLARFLAKTIAKSPWGEERGLPEIVHDDQSIYRFARAIIMPAEMVLEINDDARTADLISLHFEVPLDDARLRLEELAGYFKN